MTTFNGNSKTNLDLVSPKRILVATDLTDGEYLIPHAIAQAKASGALVTLVHAILPCETLPMAVGSLDYVDWEQTEKNIEAEMLSLAGKIEAAGVTCDIVAKRGFAVDVVQEEIKASQATRLIMASHGRGRWGQFMMGSVANQLLGNVNIPVFVVGPKSADFPQHATPRKILHPVSLTGDYRRGVELAMNLAHTFHAELTLLHIPDRDIEASIHPGCTLSWAENLFATLIPNNQEMVIPVKIDVAFGNLVNEIRKGADRIGADWIVLGVNEGLPLWPILESTAYKVLAVANCPVLAFQSNAQQVQHAKVAESSSLATIG